MQHHRFAILFSAAALCSAPIAQAADQVAQAASLNVSQGEVLLSRGTGYQTIKGSADLLTGDTVLTKPGSAAQLVFADGCTVSLPIGTIYRVGTQSPCKRHGAGFGAWGATKTQDDGWTAQTQQDQEDQKDKGGWFGDWTSNPVLPYVLAAGFVGGIAAVIASNGNSGPASP